MEGYGERKTQQRRQRCGGEEGDRGREGWIREGEVGRNKGLE